MFPQRKFLNAFAARNYINCRFCSRTHQQKLSNISIKPPDAIQDRNKRRKDSLKLANYFNKSPHLSQIRQYIPTKYLSLKRPYTTENLYLVDSRIAKAVVRHVMPSIQEGHQLICETGAGLGLISSELLDTGVKFIRIYEACPEFRSTLRDFNTAYPGRIELFVKDIFQLGRISALDKMDKHNRIEQLLKGVPKKKWKEGPVMTIIGTMTKTAFIAYLIKMLALQSEIVNYGRVQLFAIMRPGDYVKLAAGPEQNLHTYQNLSVLFNLFFKYTLLDEFPRQAFLPWEMDERISPHTRYIKRVELNKLYLVKITFKRTLPVELNQLMPLYYFVRQFFGRGTNLIIPTVEKWIPGCGLNFIAPALDHKVFNKNISIFTKFGELKPIEILGLFKEMINHPNYPGSSFAAMIQSELLKSETRETLINDEMPQRDIISDLEEKLNF